MENIINKIIKIIKYYYELVCKFIKNFIDKFIDGINIVMQNDDIIEIEGTPWPLIFILIIIIIFFFSKIR